MPSRRSNRPSVPRNTSPGVYLERNNLIIDASCYPPLEPKEDPQGPPEDNHPEEEDRQHAPHEVGRTEGGTEPVGSQTVHNP